MSEPLQCSTDDLFQMIGEREAKIAALLRHIAVLEQHLRALALKEPE